MLFGVIVTMPPPRQSGRRDVFRRVVLHHEVDAAAAAAAVALELVAGRTVPRARPRTALVPVLFSGFSITFYGILSEWCGMEMEQKLICIIMEKKRSRGAILGGKVR